MPKIMNKYGNIIRDNTKLSYFLTTMNLILTVTIYQEKKNMNMKAKSCN